MIHYQIINDASLQDDLENFVTEIKGEIKCAKEDVSIGEIKVTYVDMGSAFDLGVPLHDIFNYSRNLYEVYLETYHVDGKIYQYIQSTNSVMWPCNWRGILSY